jgi:threonine/homoserine/homoserine lactone efflux protein
MLKYILIGIGYALSASLQPGPLQAFFLSKVAQQGWKRTLPAAAAPLLSDGLIALVAISFLNVLPENFRHYLGLAGGVLLLVFAWFAFQTWRENKTEQNQLAGPIPHSLLEAALVNIFNPNPYLGWSLVMGPAVMAAWAEGPGTAAALLLSFYITMISTSMAVIYLMGKALLLGEGVRRSFSLISSLLLVGLGMFFLYQAGINILD